MIKKCPVCRKSFLADNKKRKYCSLKCKREADRQRTHPSKIGICKICGKKFLKLSSNQRYCSDKCRGVRNKMKYEKSKGNKTTKWLSLRFSVLRRDNFTCQYCGRGVADGAKLEVDHIVPKIKGGKDTINNLITSCRECNKGKRDVLLTGKEMGKIKGKVKDVL